MTRPSYCDSTQKLACFNSSETFKIIRNNTHDETLSREVQVDLNNQGRVRSPGEALITRWKHVITCMGPAFLQSRASSLDIIIYDKNNDHEYNLDDTSANMIQCSAGDELCSADDELCSADDEFGSADDEFGFADDELGSADDELRSTEDELNSAYDEFGSVDDELGQLCVLGKHAVVLTQTRETIWQTHSVDGLTKQLMSDDIVVVEPANNC